MNRYFAIIILLFFLTGDGKAQDPRELLDSLEKVTITQLTSRGIDKILVYEYTCTGCLYWWRYKEDSCDFKGNGIFTYIVWFEEDKSFLTKIDNCFDYSIIRVEGDSLWDFYNANRNEIKNDIIKKPEYEITKNGSQYHVQSDVDHSKFESIKMFSGKLLELNREIKEYYFTRILNVGDLNVNYEHNNQTKLRKFQQLWERTLDREVKKKRFIKKRR